MADLEKLTIVIEGNDEEAINRIQSVIDKLGELDQKIQGSNDKKMFTSLDMSRIESTLESIKTSVENMSGAFSNIPTEGITNAIENMKDLEQSAKNTKDAIDNISTATPNVQDNEVTPSDFNNPLEDVAPATAEAVSRTNILVGAWRLVKDMIDMAGAGISTLASKISGAVSRVWGFAGATASAGMHLAKIGMFPFGVVAQGFSTIANKVKGVGSQILRMVKMRIYRLIAKQIIGGFTEGLKNAYQWAKTTGNQFAQSMDMLATSSQYLKNSLGAMATPLINALAPAIDFIVDKFVGLLNIINQVVAKLTGKDTWVRALKMPKAFAEATDSATGSAKQLQKELITILGIDEINPMEGMDDTPSGGGGGGGSGLDYGSMFTEEAVEISGKLAEFFDPIKKAWEEKGQGVMNAWKNALESTQSLISTVGDSFWTVWTNGTGQKTMELILDILTNILNTFGNLASAFEKGWKTGDVGTSIIQGLWDILNDVLDMFADITLATSEWAGSLNFTPVLNAFKGLLTAISPVVDKITDGLSWAYTNVLLPFGKWAIEEAFPRMLGVVSSAFEVIDAVLTAVKPVLKWVWEEFLSPLASWTGGVITTVLDTMASLFETIAGWVEKISGWIQDILEFLGLADGIDKENVGKVNEATNTLPTESSSLNPLTMAVDDQGNPIVEVTGKITNITDNAIPKNSSLRDIVTKASLTSANVMASLGIPDIDSKAKLISSVVSRALTIPDVDSRAKFIQSEVAQILGVPAVDSKAQLVTSAIMKELGVPEIDSTGNITSASPNESTARFLRETGLDMSGHLTQAIDGIPDADKKVNTVAKLVSRILGKDVDSPVEATWKRSGTDLNGLDYVTLAWYRKGVGGTGMLNGLDYVALAWYRKGVGGTGMLNGLAHVVLPWYRKGVGGTGMLNGLDYVTLAWYRKGVGGTGMLNGLDYVALAWYRSGLKNFPDYIKSIWYRNGFQNFPSAISATWYISKATLQGRNVTSLVTGESQKEKGGSFYGGKWHDIPQYALGGAPSHGTLFYAGERGAELVGHVGGRTEVLNQSQLASTMYSSVVSANASQNRLLQEQNNLLRELISAQGNSRAYITAGDIVDALSQRNRRDGRTVVPIGV